LQPSPESSKLFFVLSGEHASLPAAEVQAILDSSGAPCSEVLQSYRLLTLQASSEVLKQISDRSLMYDWCGVELGRCEADESEIRKLVKSLPLEGVAKNASSYAVRSMRLGGVTKSIPRTKLERDIGGIVKDEVPRLRVKLRGPDLTFACVLFDDLFLFGAEGFWKASGLIAPRRPRKRPVFHPSTMPPKIARCMVNLARAIPRETFADPFSGVGGIVIEAAVIGCETVAVDASYRMLRGAKRNTTHFGLDVKGFVHADARHLPLHGLDAVATDPPYGRGSSTMGAKVADLVEDFLSNARDALRSKAHVCISSPVEVDIESYARSAGLKVKEKHLAKVHRSLTRQFVVLQNP
jgi:tRNA (guanine10-N2)-dimethyltransferase